MKKVVVKAKLHGRSKFVSMIENIDLKCSEPYWQHDRIFVTKNYHYDSDEPRVYFRTIVKDPKKPATYEIILHRHLVDQDYDLFFTTGIKDYSEAVMIMYQLGFDLKSEFTRRRQELLLTKNIHLYIDKFDNVPNYYVRAEMLLDDEDDATIAKEDLKQTLIAFEINKKDFTDETYDEILDIEKAVNP